MQDVLDFEIYSYNDKPVIAASSVDSFDIKETFNYLDFDEAMNWVGQIAFSPAFCSNNEDPLILNLRIMSENVIIYPQIATSLIKQIPYEHQLSAQYSLQNYCHNLTTLPLAKTFKNKVIIAIDNTTYQNLINTCPLYQHCTQIDTLTTKYEKPGTVPPIPEGTSTMWAGCSGCRPYEGDDTGCGPGMRPWVMCTDNTGSYYVAGKSKYAIAKSAATRNPKSRYYKKKCHDVVNPTTYKTGATLRDQYKIGSGTGVCSGPPKIPKENNAMGKSTVWAGCSSCRPYEGDDTGCGIGMRPWVMCTDKTGSYYVAGKSKLGIAKSAATRNPKSRYYKKKCHELVNPTTYYTGKAYNEQYRVDPGSTCGIPTWPLFNPANPKPPSPSKPTTDIYTTTFISDSQSQFHDLSGQRCLSPNLLEVAHLHDKSPYFNIMRNYELKVQTDIQTLANNNKTSLTLLLPDYGPNAKNLNPSIGMNYGCQMIGMSFQNFDNNMEFYNLLFNQLRSAFAYKPASLRYIQKYISLPPSLPPSINVAPRDVTIELSTGTHSLGTIPIIPSENSSSDSTTEPNGASDSGTQNASAT